MKKIIGILGVVMIAVAMFFSVNTINSSKEDLDLASLIAINSASAEQQGGGGTYCSTGNNGCSTAKTWCHKVTYNHTCSE